MIAILAIALIAAIGIGVFAMGLGGGSSDNGGGSDDTSDSGTEGEGTEGGGNTGDGTTSTDTYGDLSVEYVSGTSGCYTITTSNGLTTLTFSNVTEDTEYKVSGTMTGNIYVDAGGYEFKLGLSNLSLTSSSEVPIYVTNGDKFTLSANNGTDNYVYDTRSEVSSDGISAAIYCDCDMDVQGKGALTVTSVYNNGIHGKDNLEIKNLTLKVSSVDNCLKGNDKVVIESGTITLSASSGDAIKTTNTAYSNKGNQFGYVEINSDEGDTMLIVYAYCDGIDAASDVYIEQTTGSLSVSIYTYKYAYTSTSLGAMPSWGGNSNGWQQGGGIDSQGNTNTVDFSCKGIKAANTIQISSGTVYVKAYDDAMHSDNTTILESTNAYGEGSITISGGTVTLFSCDDGAHADGNLTVSGGTVTVSSSYEGLEGSKITISGGNVSVKSSDDGINATASGLVLSGGYLYVYAGGDGLDTNYSSIKFSGTNVILISTSGGNSAIDADYSYTYSKGIILAICPSGMTEEITNSSTFQSYGTQKSLGSVSSGTVIKASVNGTLMAAVKMPASLSNAVAFYIGSNSATIETGSVSNLDENGAYVKS